MTTGRAEAWCLNQAVRVQSVTMLRGMRYGPGSPRMRPNDRGSSSRDPATTKKRKSPGSALGVSLTIIQKWRKRTTTRRRPHGAQGAPLHRPDAGAGGHGRSVPQAYAAAAGRLPLRPPAQHPQLTRLTSAWSVTASPDCPMATATSQPRRDSRATPSATSTSTSQSSGPNKARRASLSASTTPESSPSSGRLKARARWRPQTSCVS